jgi:hypothetical protein
MLVTLLLLTSAFVEEATYITWTDGLVYGPLRSYEGTYRFGFETNTFTPCGESERWWVKAVDEDIASAAQGTTNSDMEIAETTPVTQGPPEGVYKVRHRFVRLEGRVTVDPLTALNFSGRLNERQNGRYGHMGMSDGYLLVSRVIDSEFPDGNNDCPTQ